MNFSLNMFWHLLLLLLLVASSNSRRRQQYTDTAYGCGTGFLE